MRVEGDHATAPAKGATTSGDAASNTEAAERESTADEVMELAADAKVVVACLKGRGAAADLLGQSGYEEVTARAEDGAAIAIYLFRELMAACRTLVGTAGAGSKSLLASEADEALARQCTVEG